MLQHWTASRISFLIWSNSVNWVLIIPILWQRPSWALIRQQLLNQVANNSRLKGLVTNRWRSTIFKFRKLFLILFTGDHQGGDRSLIALLADKFDQFPTIHVIPKWEPHQGQCDTSPGKGWVSRRLISTTKAMDDGPFFNSLTEETLALLVKWSATIILTIMSSTIK